MSEINKEEIRDKAVRLNGLIHQNEIPPICIEGIRDALRKHPTINSVLMSSAATNKDWIDAKSGLDSIFQMISDAVQNRTN